jgi:NitT/TauT family transport system substrate-binding protein
MKATLQIPRRRFLRLACWSTLLPLGLPLGLPLLGCAPPAPVKIASHIWPGYEPLFLAHEIGPWPDSLKLVELPAASDSLDALAAGLIQGATLTLDEVLRANANGHDLRVAAVMDISSGADMLLARPERSSLSALRGARIGVEHSAVGALMLAASLKAAGIAAAEIEIVYLPPPQQEVAWAAGQIDAVITYEPTATRLLRTGASRLFDSRVVPDTILDVLAVEHRVIASRPTAVRDLVSAHFIGLPHFISHAKDAHHRMARRLKLPAGEVPSLFRGLHLPGIRENERLLAGPDALLGKNAQKLAALMVENGLLPIQSIYQDFTALADASFLPKQIRGTG